MPASAKIAAQPVLPFNGHAVEHLRCSKCGENLGLSSDDYRDGLVTYWGESDPAVFECGYCGHENAVKETVVRTWRVIT